MLAAHAICTARENDVGGLVLYNARVFVGRIYQTPTSRLPFSRALSTHNVIATLAKILMLRPRRLVTRPW